MRWVVIGAGTAGSVVAHRLGEHAGNQVTVFETGPDLVGGAVPAAIDSIDYVDALATDRLDASLMVTRRASAPPVAYPRGRGVGGSSAVNGMMMDLGDLDQYRRWGWNDVAEAAARVRVPATTVADEQLGTIDRLLLAELPGAHAVSLSIANGRRVTTGARYLDVARNRHNVDVVTGRRVERVEVRGNSASGVVTDDGAFVDADAVVVSAGALASPAILLRSGFGGDRDDAAGGDAGFGAAAGAGSGVGVQDHPSATFTLHRRAPFDPFAGDSRGVTVGTGVVAVLGDLHVSGVNRLAATGPLAELSAVTVSLLRPRSRGRVGIDDDGEAVVDLRELSEPDDLRRLVRGVDQLIDLVSTSSFVTEYDDVTIDERGTSLDALDSHDAIEQWLLETPTGTHVHASSSCPMGTVVDDDGAVAGMTNLFVVDASVFPAIPAAPTYLPTLMLAERLAPRVHARLAGRR